MAALVGTAGDSNENGDCFKANSLFEAIRLKQSQLRASVNQDSEITRVSDWCVKQSLTLPHEWQ